MKIHGGATSWEKIKKEKNKRKKSFIAWTTFGSLNRPIAASGTLFLFQKMKIHTHMDPHAHAFHVIHSWQGPTSSHLICHIRLIYHLHLVSTWSTHTYHSYSNNNIHILVCCDYHIHILHNFVQIIQCLQGFKYCCYLLKKDSL